MQEIIIMKYLTSEIYVGNELTNNQGNVLTILDVVERRVTVEFHNTMFVKVVDKHHLRDGRARDPYEPTKYGIACVGVVKNYPKEDYKRWENMIERCYRGGGVGNYKDCTVCSDWLVFENFYRDIQGLKNYGLPNMHLDKDLVKKGNRVYSLATCQFISSVLNSSHGSFTGRWRAEKGTVVMYATHSAELGALIGVTGSAIRNGCKRTNTGWIISVEK